MARRRVDVGGLRLGTRERAYLSRVIASNHLSYGPFTRRFERLFARAHGRAHGVFCNSGQSALHVALQALKERHGWKDGDEVLVPAVTYVSTANVVLHNRLTPVFVDVDAREFGMDPALVEAKLTRRTRAMIPAHLFGLPADMARLAPLARRRGLRVVEDSCETVFARCGGKVAGSFGDAACFSTYVAHYIVTGVGGVAVTGDADLAARMRSLVNHGRDPRAPKSFRFSSIGHSFRATELEAALGVAQLERKTALVRARQALAARLTRRLADLRDVLQLPFVPEGREHVYMMYPLVARGRDKAPLTRFLARRGVETRELLPLLSQPAYRTLFGDLLGRYPVARALDRSGFYVGCHPQMTLADADYLADLLHEFFGR